MTRVMVDSTLHDVHKDQLTFDDILVLAQKGGCAWFVIVHERAHGSYALTQNGCVTVRPGLALKVVNGISRRIV